VTSLFAYIYSHFSSEFIPYLVDPVVVDTVTRSVLKVGGVVYGSVVGSHFFLSFFSEFILIDKKQIRAISEIIRRKIMLSSDHLIYPNELEEIFGCDLVNYVRSTSNYIMWRLIPLIVTRIPQSYYESLAKMINSANIALSSPNEGEEIISSCLEKVIRKEIWWNELKCFYIAIIIYIILALAIAFCLYLIGISDNTSKLPHPNKL